MWYSIPDKNKDVGSKPPDRHKGENHDQQINSERRDRRAHGKSVLTRRKLLLRRSMRTELQTGGQLVQRSRKARACRRYVYVRLYGNVRASRENRHRGRDALRQTRGGEREPSRHSPSRPQLLLRIRRKKER